MPSVVAPTPPAGLRQLDSWLDYRRAAHLVALPEESRIFYRRGLLSLDAGDRDEAMRLMRGAVELDPSFLAARVALLRSEMTRNPSQALAQVAGIADLLRRDFATQWTLVGDASYTIVNAWLLALLGLGLLLLMVHNGELRHMIRERVQGWATPASSRAWAWVLIAAPFALGCGLTLPVLGGLGLLWPVLRVRERAVWVMLFASLVTLPLAARVFDSLALPMRADSPLGAVLPLETQTWTPEAAAAMRALSAAHPHDPFARFGEGWLELHHGEPVAAEAAYREVLQAWPGDDRALDNLGTALLQQGRRVEAMDAYQHAIAANRLNAIAYFNLAQAHLLGFDFDEASRAMSRASALDFDQVRDYKNQPARNGALDPVPDWIAPHRQWVALRNGGVADPQAAPELPPSWRDAVETSWALFPWIALAVGLLSVGLGMWLNRALPLYRCVNCERVLCRRCAERRKAQAMCATCARVARGAASPDFARILLQRQRERSMRMMRGARFAFALVAPGAGLVMARRVWRALALLALGALLVTAWPGTTWPYAARPRVGITTDPWGLDWLIPLAFIYLLSIGAYLAERARAARAEHALGRSLRTRRSVSTRVDEPPSQQEVA